MRSAAMALAALTATALMAAAAVAGAAGAPASAAPSWAFPVSAPPHVPAAQATQRGESSAEAETPRHVPGSRASFTPAQVGDLYTVPDWFPDSHPPMPPVVAGGRRPKVMACGFCHLPNGQGRPENAPLAGLPADYIAEQIQDFRAGLRLTAGPVGGPLAAMLAVARNVSDADVAAAAKYFSGLRFQPWIRVVETTRVPRTRVVGWMFVPVASGGTEPLGDRIIEMPANAALTELRDAHSGFIAYVPPGSLRRGAELVRTGGDGRTIRCGICHGENLEGLGGIPPLAGRSPSYLMRQMYDIRYGARGGLRTQLMREPMAKLTTDDMLAIAAYLASLKP